MSNAEPRYYGFRSDLDERLDSEDELLLDELEEDWPRGSTTSATSTSTPSGRSSGAGRLTIHLLA